MIKYGLISETDARTLEKTIDLICDEFDEKTLNVTEIGIFDGQTARGIYEYIISKEYPFYDIELQRSINKDYECNYTAIDNEKDKPIQLPFPECKLIIGNSNEVYNQIEDNSQHLCFIDGGHDFPTVISDWYCYKNKVMVGGFLCFHDTSPQAQGRDWQRKGDENDPDMSISVLKALNEIGLMQGRVDGWGLVFNEFDPEDRCGGVCCFRRIS
jgi:hypothetical protein